MTYSITTRTGDSGTSSLYSGERILKSDEVFDIVGDVDELNSVLGIAAVATHNKWFKNKNIKYDKINLFFTANLTLNLLYNRLLLQVSSWSFSLSP